MNFGDFPTWKFHLKIGFEAFALNTYLMSVRVALGSRRVIGRGLNCNVRIQYGAYCYIDMLLYVSLTIKSYPKYHNYRHMYVHL